MELSRLNDMSYEMFAEQCDNRNAAPLVNPTVDKDDFHLRMKGVPPSSPTKSLSVSMSVLEPTSHHSTPHDWTITSSAFGASRVHGEEDFSYAPPPPPGYYTQSALIPKVDTNPASFIEPNYSGVATHSYASSLFAMNSPVQREQASTSATPWWDVGDPETVSKWLDMSGAAPTQQNYATDKSHPQLRDTMLPDDRLKAHAVVTCPQTEQLPKCRSRHDDFNGFSPKYYSHSDSECPNSVETSSLMSTSTLQRGRKVHSCHITGCNKIVRSAGHLKSHLRSHSCERPFVCNWLLCRKAFKHNFALRRHIKIHTGENRFKCRFCTKRFFYTEQLDYHENMHENVGDVTKDVSNFDTFSDSQNSHLKPSSQGSPHLNDLPLP